jgi:pyrroloquinoline-quinone synthase
MRFYEELYAAARPFPIETHPFVIAVRAGEASRDDVRSYAVHLHAAAESFLHSLYLILGVCTDADVRRSLMSNVLEEEGARSYVPGQGATFDPARRHPAMARRFARAAGASDAEIDAFAVGMPRWFRFALRDGNWLGAFAYVAVGIESNVPATYRLLIPPLVERYGFSEHDLEFLTEHVGADDRHGLDGAMLIESVSTTDAARRQALEGARRGSVGWWEILRKHARAGAAVA